MMGAMSPRLKGRLWSASAAALVGLSLACAAIGPAEADKVGVAAAVNPDAFSSLAGSPQSQLSIGKSIFYNERINTTGSGLVQVLLVDGSTFTVGPGSDLVIDKFVYDPKKGTGQIAASFSKGVMRFVGGKISKNDNGVTVNTPAGALAIRGAIAYADFKSPKNYAALLVFGDYLKLQGQTVFQTGYGIFSNNGQLTTRPFTPGDLAGIMAALTNGNPGTPGKPDGPNTSNAKLLSTTSLNQLISDANATQIQGEIDEQLANQESGQPTPIPGTGQPTPNLSQGYAAGIFKQISGPEEDFSIGTLSNLSPSEVALLFNGPGGAFSGASFNLFVNGGEFGEGGAKIVFSPLDLQTALPDGFPEGSAEQLGQLGLFVGGATSAVENAIIVYDNTEPGPNGPVLTGKERLNEGQAALVGVSGNGQVFCQSCSFLKWGAWLADLDFQKDSESQPDHVRVAGWFVSGDLPTLGQLPFQGTATYDGTTIGTVAALIQQCEGSQPVTYIATGEVHMDWDFGQHAGMLAINNFDTNRPGGPLNVSGRMDVPGELANIATNKFSGALLGTLGSSNIGGGANGSFVANGTDKTAGIIGNWGVGNESYRATGVFGAGRVGAVNPDGHLDLPEPPRLTSFDGPHGN
jgi:hypothetical protein